MVINHIDVDGYTTEAHYHRCYYCGASWTDHIPPTAKDDCGICDRDAED